MFQDYEGFVLHDDASDDVGRHDHAKRQGVILEYEWNVRANCLYRLPIVGDDLIVGTQSVGRADHNA